MKYIGKTFEVIFLLFVLSTASISYYTNPYFIEGYSSVPCCNLSRGCYSCNSAQDYSVQIITIYNIFKKPISQEGLNQDLPIVYHRSRSRWRKR